MTIKQKEFCANHLCPHHKLPMRDDFHYHQGDEGVISSVCGILYTHPYDIKKVIYGSKQKWLIFTETAEETIVVVVYFCDICNEAIQRVIRYL